MNRILLAIIFVVTNVAFIAHIWDNFYRDRFEDESEVKYFSFDKYIGKGDGKLLNVEGFETLNLPECDEDTFLVMFIHSSPNHFQHRRNIRKTWGSVRSYRNLKIKIFFVLGMSEEPTTDARIDTEAKVYSDIIWSKFKDTYWNLTLKHLIALHYITDLCKNVSYIVKSDDDIFISTFQLLNYILENFGPKPSGLLACAVAKSVPVRRQGKWRVSPSEFIFTFYPDYCSGAAYVASLDVAKSLSRSSRSIPPFRIDDVFVTGIIREKIAIKLHRLNIYFTENELMMKERADGALKEQPAWIFGVASAD